MQTADGFILPTARIEAQSTSPGPQAAQAGCPLSGDAIRLMCVLDGKIVVDRTADRFPRVLNRVASLWKKPAEADRYFEELLNDSRGSRQGFPLGVLSEINALRDFYNTRVYPKRVDPWDHVVYR